MASPSATTFQRPDLGLLFEQYDLMQDMGIVGLEVLPPFPVARQTANFSVVKLADLLQDLDLSRSPGGAYKRGDYQFAQDNYASIEYGTEEPIDDRERSLYSYSFDIERIAADRARARILRALEKRIASKIQATGTFSNAAAATLWSTTASAAPIKDVESALIAIRNACGVNAEQIDGVCDWQLFLYLKNCAQIKEVIKYSGIDDPKNWNMTKDAIAAALGIRRLIVANPMKNTADKGQSATLAPVWDKQYFFLGKLAKSNDLQEPCVGRTFAWTGDGASEAGVVEEYREEAIRSQVMRVRNDTHEKILFAAAGYLITGCA